MKISNIEIKNFKSFKNISINLNDFNVVVGPSASGKSNFIEAFKFLKDISEDFENGILNHGGVFFQNFNCNKKVPSCIKATIGEDKAFVEIPHPIKINNKEIMTKIYYTSIDYELCINFKSNEIEFITETVNFNFNINDDESNDLLSKNTLYLRNNDGVISAEFENNDEYVDLEFFVPNSLLNIVNNNFKENKGLLINSPLSAIPISWSNYFKEINVYNFNPYMSKMSRFKGNSIISEHGENLAFVLDRILSNKEDKRKFLNLVSILLPYVKDIEINKISDDKKIFNLIESYNELPIFAPFVSDGTTNILALICALYFTKSNAILIEEPERNIHPGLLIQLVGMMKEVSSLDKQIIITTHSPEILNNCNLDDIIFISRNNDGFSILSEPADNKDVKEFIKELSIGELFIEGCLE